ncbi:ARM repeat-containing protein [Aureobasidium pullulans]|uniref:ARM repeat-containing protein n=1 Tax=Aureobasidium pullulans TaxID=5580 RepID=A0A4S9AE56_AURPU|nr:ARM repeat-containing protein [Aureobasidium pullulans]THY29696.1 ARM repeat-containing protein [Aureobasidium pullulans]
MAFSKGLSDRPDGALLYRPQQSPREDAPYPTSATTFPSPLSPLRNLSLAATAAEGRGSLQRRFTTNALPTLSPIAQQRRQAADPAMTAFNKITPTERKTRQYEELLAQQRRIQAQMAMIDPETRREVDEQQKLEQDITMFTTGHLSEPTTPPDYYSSVNRVHSARLSTASMASPPGFPTRPSRSGSQLTSPHAAFSRPVTSHTHTSSIPSRSVPASRRGSDEDEEENAYSFADINHRAAANLNRNSMPVKMAELSSLLGSVNTTGFLFGDEDDHKSTRVQNQAASPDANNYLQLQTSNDKFPILVRRDGEGMQLSASSAAMELAQAQQNGSDNQLMTDRTNASRTNRQSLPPSAMRQTGYGEAAMSPLNGILTELNTAKNTAANRRSVEVKFSGLATSKRPGLLASPKGIGSNGVPKLQGSYSTNDIPTLKSTNAGNLSDISGAVQSPRPEFISPARQTSVLGNGHQNGFHTPSRQEQNKPEEHSSAASQRSGLQASAAPFGPSVASPSFEPARAFNAITNANSNGNGHSSPLSMQSYGNGAYYGGYGMQMLGNGFNQMYVGNQGGGQWASPPGPMPGFQHGFGGGYSQQLSQQSPARYNDSQARVMQQRRSQNGEDNSRYLNVDLQDVVGEIYGLCKDQHGCRYLQKKLEEGNAENIRLIFEETNPHMIELMTDPFGNYLCQKLLEYANDDQRTVLIRAAAPSMVKIALNQHGTRALQKMIEFISTPEQIEIITEALRYEVVPLIQDLNGNHVIQKCLNHLSPEDAQFIFDAVGTSCVIVGTHRHGCCVLQRCIDHASGNQKGQLVQYITMNAFTLVQDPFGNYVVQYILDLGEPAFSEPLAESFLGNVAILSRQKFSSNVIEKSIRTGNENTRRALINEIMNPVDLEKLLRDSYANYVVQTAMDYADPETKARLIDNIRPILHSIRHTPYGRRIAGKIQDYDQHLNGLPGAISPPSTMTPSQIGSTPFRTSRSNTVSSYTSNSPVGNSVGNYGASSMGSPTSHHRHHGSINNMLAQPGQQQSNGFGQGYQQFGHASRASRSSNMGNY